MAKAFKKLLLILLLPLFLLSFSLFASEPTYDEAKAKVAELVKKFDAKKTFI